ncbi:MAG TPA: signal peptidase II [Candidatus Limnocylindrales bacterium]|nr:signal peptidase II [Candidatus Limnocylindrales bacterium]
MSIAASSNQRRAELLTLGLTALLVLVADQLTKAAVVSGLALGERAQVLGDLVVIWHVQNSGSAFSLFQFEGSLILFYVVHLVALGMVAYFHRTFHGRGLWLQLILGIVLGGSIGNLADRLRQGYVTDFISVGFGDVRFPTWNIADAGITVGITLLVAYLVLLEPRRAETGA